jgi:methionine synthase reductase
VNFIIDRLGICHESDRTIAIKLDERTTKKNTKLPVFMPKYGTYRRLLTEVLDLRNIPKKLFLRSLVECTKDVNEKRFLEIMCSKEGTIPYRNLILDKEGTVLQLLETLKSCRPSFKLLLENLPRLMPRPYSIANSSSIDKQKIRIVFSIYREADLKGLTSSFLENSIQNGNIPFYFRNQTAFSFNEADMNCNQILIGVGTAISPYFGFLEQKSVLKSSGNGETWLLVGCRYKNRNHIYENQLKQYLNEGTLSRIYEAFSRDSPGKHVQNLILENKAEFLEFLLNEKTRLYVCGSPKMVEDIQQILERSLAEVQSSTVDDIKKKIVEWKKSKKYVEDVWH